MRRGRNRSQGCDFFVSNIYASRVDVADKETNYLTSPGGLRLRFIPAKGHGYPQMWQ